MIDFPQLSVYNALNTRNTDEQHVLTFLNLYMAYRKAYMGLL